MRKLASYLALAVAVVMLSGAFVTPSVAAVKDKTKDKTDKSDKKMKKDKGDKTDKSDKKGKKGKKGSSLYDRLGGKDAIIAVVGEFVANVGADARINGRFANTNLDHLKMMLVDQICMATGGPCAYTGKDMVSAHKGMNITDAEFTALVEDLVAALNKFNVPQTEQDELLGALGGMKPQIVGQ